MLSTILGRYREDIVNEFSGRPLKIRNHAKGYKSLLNQIGFPAYQSKQLQLSISGQPYWRHEAEFSKQESNRREYELKTRWRQQDEKRQKRQTKQPRSNSLTQTADHPCVESDQIESSVRRSG